MENGIQQPDVALELMGPSFVRLFYRRSVLNETLDRLSEFGYEIVTFDAARWNDEDDFHEDVARELDFPDYYGANIPAFGDSLRPIVASGHVRNPNAAGLIIVITGYDKFAKSHAEIAWEIIDEFAQRARMAMLIGNRMLCLLQSDDPDIKFAPVGATPVLWNFTEWQDAARKSGSTS